jgi:hypothetical protein
MSAEILFSVLLIGAGATLATDVLAVVRNRLFGTPPPNYAFVGRWIAHLARGKLRHDAIARASAVRGEAAIGWISHYAIGMGFAFLLPAFFGLQWIRQPTFIPALLVGAGTVLAPFLVMQPAMGAGFAASRTPRPAAARLQSLANHTVFGVGLFATATALAYLRQT